MWKYVGFFSFFNFCFGKLLAERFHGVFMRHSWRPDRLVIFFHEFGEGIRRSRRNQSGAPSTWSFACHTTDFVHKEFEPKTWKKQEWKLYITDNLHMALTNRKTSWFCGFLTGFLLLFQRLVQQSNYRKAKINNKVSSLITSMLHS